MRMLLKPRTKEWSVRNVISNLELKDGGGVMLPPSLELKDGGGEMLSPT